MVWSAASQGQTQEDIARALRISEPTLRKYFAEELEQAYFQANLAVGANLYRMATGKGREALTAAIFWAKCRMGWREADKVAAAAGKKEEQQTAAHEAGRGTEWGKDLTPPGFAN